MVQVSRIDHLSVRLSVCQSVGKVYCIAKRLTGWLSSKAKGQVWGEVGALLHSCAKVLLFELVIGVSRGMGVLEGSHVPQTEGGFREFIVSIGFNGVF